MTAPAGRLLTRNGRYWLLHDVEVIALDPLPLWIKALFIALVRCSDFETGRGSTTYGQLVKALAVPQPARGRRHFQPDAQAIKRAILKLERLRLVCRDVVRSDIEKRLFFDVLDRRAEIRPTSKFDPLIRSHVDKRKPSNGAALRGH